MFASLNRWRRSGTVYMERLAGGEDFQERPWLLFYVFFFSSEFDVSNCFYVCSGYRAEQAKVLRRQTLQLYGGWLNQYTILCHEPVLDVS
jgi:hypothetical protein